MEDSFWHQRWENNEIAFHQSETNPALIRHFERLNIEEGSRILLPLSGKTRDALWFLEKGYRVACVELSEIAVKQFFDAIDIVPTVSSLGGFKLYQSEGIDFFVGDIFELNADILGTVDAIYDRAALVALPLEMRIRYTERLITITKTAPQLLLCFEYDQTLMSGPPFSISTEEVLEHYQSNYICEHLESNNIEGGFRGNPAKGTAWVLSAKQV